MKLVKVLKEAKEKEIETDVEKKLKKKLIDFLRTGQLKDSKTGKVTQYCPPHAKFAARLDDFLLKIVDRKDDPEMTAAISWEDDTIYVSSGFITNDNDLFYQLNVLMRHELAHNLMCHEIRMMRKITEKYGEKGATHIKMSNSIHQLLNIIEDFEISNKRYTKEDKQTVEHMLIGGQLIVGLVTESHRSNWATMSVEDMYDALLVEIANIQARILAKFDALDLADSSLGNSKDFITRSVVGSLNVYTDINHPTNFFGPLDLYIKDKALYHFTPYDTPNGVCVIKFSSLPDLYQEIIMEIEKEFKEANGYYKQDLRDLIVKIAKSSPIDRFDLKTKNNKVLLELYTPEEKFLAIDCLKAVIPTLEEYNTWYEKVKKTLSDPKYSGDLQRIYDEVNK